MAGVLCAGDRRSLSASTHLFGRYARGRLGVPPAAAPKSLAVLTGGLSNQLVLLTGGESTRQSMADQILLSGALQTNRSTSNCRPLLRPTRPPASCRRVKSRRPSNPLPCACPRNACTCGPGRFQLPLVSPPLGSLGWKRTQPDFRTSGRLRFELAGSNARWGSKNPALAPVVGPAVIADVAIIGTDTFLARRRRHGHLVPGAEQPVLGADIQRQRPESLKAMPGATEEKLSIAGKEVSLVSTPDNALRSFYVADGDFHLVCTSRRSSQRFLETGSRKTRTMRPGDVARRLGRVSAGADKLAARAGRHDLRLPFPGLLPQSDEPPLPGRDAPPAPIFGGDGTGRTGPAGRGAARDMRR